MINIYTLTLKITTFNPQNFFNIEKVLKKFKRKKQKFFKKVKIQNIIKSKNKIKNFTVLKSPHIYKKSQEHFQYKNFEIIYKIKSKKLLPLLFFLFFIKKIPSKDYIFKSTINSKCL